MRKIVAIILFLFLSYSISAEVGLSSTPLLRQPGSPTESAYLGGGLIMGSSIYDANINPANIALQDYTEIYSSFQTLPFGVSSQNLGYTKPLGFGVAGGGISYLGIPNITTVDENFQEGSTSTYDLKASGLYALHFSDFSLGMQGNFIQSKLGDYVARSVSLDFGSVLFFDFPSIFKRSKNLNFGIGLSAKNISTGIQYGELTTALPLTYAGGIYYNLTNFKGFEMNLELYFKRIHKTEDLQGAALEIKLAKYYIIRGGLAQVKTDGSSEATIKFAGGASILVDLYGYVYDIAYSATPTNEFGLLHHIGLRMQLGGGKRLPFGIGEKSSRSKKKSGIPDNNDVVTSDGINYGGLDGLNKDDRTTLIYLRSTIASYNKQKGRNPRDLNDLLLYLSKYNVYDIPNPTEGRYRYNKRTGKLFIQK